MIQEISPNKFHNEFYPITVDNNSVVFVFKDNKILCCNDNGIIYPLYSDIDHSDFEYIYLFAIDDINFFLAMSDITISDSRFNYESISILRSSSPKNMVFAGLNAWHLYCWYRDNKICGRCGHTLHPDSKERMQYCESCDNRIYPKIAPVVIISITDGDKLLMTRYANSEYKCYSLVAGFVEFGETAEEAVRREILEEVGVKVKNIRYLFSQPWGLSQSLLLGFTAELDGSSDIRLDTNELSEGVWVSRSEIETVCDDFSMTNQMICNFKDNL